ITNPLNVDNLEDVEVVLELLGHPRDGDVAQVDLVPLHQVKQQVKRAVEDFEVYLVLHRCTRRLRQLARPAWGPFSIVSGGAAGGYGGHARLVSASLLADLEAEPVVQ